MGKSTTSSFVVSLRLLTTKEDEQELEYRFRAGAHLYNLCVKEARKRVHKMLKDAEYKARRKAYSGTKKEPLTFYSKMESRFISKKSETFAQWKARTIDRVFVLEKIM